MEYLVPLLYTVELVLDRLNILLSLNLLQSVLLVLVNTANQMLCQVFQDVLLLQFGLIHSANLTLASLLIARIPISSTLSIIFIISMVVCVGAKD